MGEVYSVLLVKQILRILKCSLKNYRLFYPLEKICKNWLLCFLLVKFFLNKFTSLRVKHEWPTLKMTNIMWDVLSSNIKGNILFDILKVIFCKFGELFRFATPATQNHNNQIYCFFFLEWEWLREPVYILFVYLKLWKIILYLNNWKLLWERIEFLDMKPLKIYRKFQHRTYNNFNFNFSYHSCNMEHGALYPTQHIDLTVLVWFSEKN